jgi:hypothetical protein
LRTSGDQIGARHDPALDFGVGQRKGELVVISRQSTQKHDRPQLNEASSMSPRESSKPSGLRWLLLLAAEGVIVFYLALDALVAPLFRPLLRWLAKLRLVLRFERFVADLPPYGILALLAIPFGLAELAKVYAVFLIATGLERTGWTIFILAYLVSFIFVERTYSAGKAKLRTIGWFARLMDWLAAFRDHLLEWVRSTQAFAFFSRLKRRFAEVIRRLRLRFALQWRRLRP